MMSTVFYPVSEPDLTGKEKSYVNEAVDDGWISSNGKFIGQFEHEFAAFVGTKHAISCCNGTVALHLILLALGLGPGDEVLVPSLTFVATANAVSYTGATPVFVDSSYDDWNIDCSRLDEALTPATRAVIAVHLYGRPCDMVSLKLFSEKHNLFLIEDAAEAPGARFCDQIVGSIGLAASFSFYGNKIISTGEGGMVTTDDDELAANMRLLKGQGMDPQRRYWFPVIGYNYRMTNIAAAIGCAQLERVTDLMHLRSQVGNWYRKNLSSFAHDYALSWPHETNIYQHVCWLFSMTIPRVHRDALMVYLMERGVETRPFFIALHTLPIYSDQRHSSGRALAAAADLGESGLSLPTFSRMTEQDVDYISSLILDYLDKNA